MRDANREIIMKAGLSKRIWAELYKVIDSSDVVAQVLDARDPQGTRAKQVEEFLKKEKPHKQLIFVLNKCDLVPTWVTRKWVAILSHDYPTLAFHASIRNPFGKGAMINLLRQFAKLHQDKKQISVGFIGYPNSGKSSVINAMRGKKVCKVAPIAGETKVWQYITLMKRIYLVDCPGVVYPHSETDTDKVLKGVVRVENIDSPEEYIPAVLERVKKEYLIKTYGITEWDDVNDFLERYARKTGKLLKKGEPDIVAVSKMILNDWQRGKLPYFVAPPEEERDEPVDESAQKMKAVLQNYSKIKQSNFEEEGDNNETEGDNNEMEEGDPATEVVDAEPADESTSQTEDKEENDDDVSDIDLDNAEEIEDLDHLLSDTDEVAVQEREEKVEEAKKKALSKLTAKQRRGLERSQKRKKTGSDFYEVTNVKNKNICNRKKYRMKLAQRGRYRTR